MKTLIQIVSPHIDDAFLSMGGTIINWINQGKDLEIIYPFTLSNWTNPLNISKIIFEKDTEKITKLRKREEKKINENLRYKYIFLDFPDRGIKPDWSDVETAKMKVDVKERLLLQLNKDATIYFPIGINHFDHILVREIGKELIDEYNYNIHFYEDLPYIAHMSNFQDFYKVIEENSVNPYWEKIDIKSKIEILKNYKSQVEESWLKLINLYSYSPKDNHYYERFWKF